MPDPLPEFACTQSSTSLYMRDPPGGMTIRVSSSDSLHNRTSSRRVIHTPGTEMHNSSSSTSEAKAFVAAIPTLTKQREAEAILDGMRTFSQDREVQYHGQIAMALLDLPDDSESELAVGSAAAANLDGRPVKLDF